MGKKSLYFKIKHHYFNVKVNCTSLKRVTRYEIIISTYKTIVTPTKIRTLYLSEVADIVMAHYFKHMTEYLSELRHGAIPREDLETTIETWFNNIAIIHDHTSTSVLSRPEEIISSILNNENKKNTQFVAINNPLFYQDGKSNGITYLYTEERQLSYTEQTLRLITSTGNYGITHRFDAKHREKESISTNLDKYLELFGILTSLSYHPNWDIISRNIPPVEREARRMLLDMRSKLWQRMQSIEVKNGKCVVDSIYGLSFCSKSNSKKRKWTTINSIYDACKLTRDEVYFAIRERHLMRYN
jgi:hypothetical protein